MRFDFGVELLGAQEQGFRRQTGALRVTLDQAVAFAGISPKVLEGRFQVAMQDDRCIGTEVVKNAGGLLEEQRQVVLDPGAGHAGTHVLVDSAAGWVSLQKFAPTTAKARPRGLVHGEFPAWQQAHFRHRVQAALTVGIKAPDAVDLVVKQINTVGHRAAHREQVNQATAHGVLTRTDDLIHMVVPGQGQLRFEFDKVELLLDLEVKGVTGQEGRWRQTVEGGAGRDQHHIGALFLVTLADAPKRGQAFADEILMG